MNRNDLTRVLNGDLNHMFNLNMYEANDPNLEVTILPKHVKAMLISYLDKKVTSEQLNSWAEFVYFRSGEYVSENWENDESADFYEDMWYVIQKLSTPEIDGEITPESVQIYLKELDKYFENNQSAANDAL